MVFTPTPRILYFNIIALKDSLRNVIGYQQCLQSYCSTNFTFCYSEDVSDNMLR